MFRNILDKLLSAVDIVKQSGEFLSDKIQGAIADNLRWLFEKSQEELSQVPLEPQTPQNLTEAMPSSNIGAFSYDDKNQRLYVRFLGKYPNREGPVYSYDGVPQQIFDLFRVGAVPARSDGNNQWGKWWKGKVPSMGASLYTLLKTAGYPYQKLSS